MMCRQKTWGLLVAGVAVMLAIFAAMLVHSGEKSPKPHTVTLTWQAAAALPGKTVARYNVYRGTTPGGPYSKLASGVRDTKYQDGLVNARTTYYYVVTSVDEAGHESQYSAEIQARVP
jgi:fibronectin type 3 domain-containing protein